MAQLSMATQKCNNNEKVKVERREFYSDFLFQHLKSVR